MRLLDLFSGIGAFSLGLERAGFQTVAFCEVEPFCQAVLRKHWPNVPIYDDVCHLTAARLRADGIDRIEAICGGFPCQDISVAGSGAGLDGERSGLWREYARLVGELRPVHVIVENVGALRGRGLARVLGDLATFGYDAQWHVVPAAAIGAPHLRERVWIIATAADADGIGLRDESGRRRGADGAGAALAADDGTSWPAADAAGQRCGTGRESEDLGRWEAGPVSDGLGAGDSGRNAAHSIGQRREERRGLQRRLARALAAVAAPWPGPTEPAFRRVDDGAAKRLDRAALKALGNSVVPQIPEAIGRALLEATA